MFGIDGVDILIHVGVTGFLMVLADIASTSHNGAGVAIVGATSLVVFGIRRQLALKKAPPVTTGEIAAQQVADIDARLQEVDHLQFRVQELEERLDFAERLLAQAREPERLS
jgi:NAD(P)H-dependent FMN reductase